MILLKQIVMIILLRQPENVARFINEHVFGNSYHLRYIVYSDYMRLLESWCSKESASDVGALHQLNPSILYRCFMKFLELTSRKRRWWPHERPVSFVDKKSLCYLGVLRKTRVSGITCNLPEYWITISFLYIWAHIYIYIYSLVEFQGYSWKFSHQELVETPICLVAEDSNSKLRNFIFSYFFYP